MRVEELAEWIGAEFEGDGGRDITGVADVAAAGAGDIAFVYGHHAARHAADSRAGCLLVPVDFPTPAKRTVIRVSDPRSVFVKTVRRFHPAKAPKPGVHPSAIISATAELAPGVSMGAYSRIGDRSKVGPGTSIGAGCQIGDDVQIGEQTLLHDNVTLYDGTKIGNGVVIHSGAVLGADGFGFVLAGESYEKFPQIGSVTIGNHVEIGANSCVDRAALGVTSIGDGTKLDNLVHIAHNVTIGKHVVIAAQTGISGGATIDDYVVIAGQVGIGEKAHVESRAVLGGQCGILPSKVLRSGLVVWGTPARPLKEYLGQLAQISKIADLRREVTSLKKTVERLKEN